MTGHIVALGGGGFSMEPSNRLLDDFILSLARRQRGISATWAHGGRPVAPSTRLMKGCNRWSARRSVGAIR